MFPNAERYNHSTEYANKLVDRIGQTPAWIALRLGVTEKRMRYILAGSRTIKGDTTEILMSYAEQFCLECLAAEAKAPICPPTSALKSSSTNTRMASATGCS